MVRNLVFGKNMGPVATLVERSTRFLMLVALPELNERPRQTLGFKTPSQALAEVLR